MGYKELRTLGFDEGMLFVIQRSNVIIDPLHGSCHHYSTCGNQVILVFEMSADNVRNSFATQSQVESQRTRLQGMLRLK